MDKSKWEYKKLGDCCKVINGLWTGKKPPFINVGVIRNANFTKSCELDNSNIAYIDVEQKAFEKRKLIKGDIIIEKSGGSDKQPVGRPILFNMDGDFSFSNFTSTLRVEDCKHLDSKYLHKVLKYNYLMGHTKAMQSNTTGLHNLDFTKYKAQIIPIPSFADQQRIVAELDCLNEMIALKQEQLKEFDKLAQSIFYDMFGEGDWESRKIKEIAKVKIGPFGSSLHQYDYVTGGTPLVNPIHMINGKIVVDNDFTITEEKKSELTSYLLKTNDIVFGRRGDIGRCALVTDKENGYLCGTGSMFVRFDIDIDPTYALCELSSKEIKKYLLDNAKGATMLNLNGGIVENITIPLPPLDLQQQFAEKIQAIEAQKELVKKSIAETQQLLDSRMDFYFN